MNSRAPSNAERSRSSEPVKVETEGSSRSGHRFVKSKAGGSRRSGRRLVLMAVPVAVLVLVGLLALLSYLHAKDVQTEGRGALDEMLEGLKQRGYTVDGTLSGRHAVGTVLQTRETDEAGNTRALGSPVVFLWADRCFPNVEPRSEPYLLVERSVSASTLAKVGGEELARRLPKLALSASAISKYSLSFVNPHTETYAKGDLSERFSPDCVRAYAAALRREKPSSFSVILDTVVVDEIIYEIEWKSNADADARMDVTRKVKETLEKDGEAGKLQVQVADATSDVSRVAGKGRIVLAYSARELEPVRADDANAGAK